MDQAVKFFHSYLKGFISILYNHLCNTRQQQTYFIILYILLLMQSSFFFASSPSPPLLFSPFLAWRYKAPQQVVFVEKLTKLVVSQLPNFWKLWISYVNGSLFSEVWILVYK